MEKALQLLGISGTDLQGSYQCELACLVFILFRGQWSCGFLHWCVVCVYTVNVHFPFVEYALNVLFISLISVAFYLLSWEFLLLFIKWQPHSWYQVLLWCCEWLIQSSEGLWLYSWFRGIPGLLLHKSHVWSCR